MSCRIYSSCCEGKGGIISVPTLSKIQRKELMSLVILQSLELGFCELMSLELGFCDLFKSYEMEVETHVHEQIENQLGYDMVWYVSIVGYDMVY